MPIPPSTGLEARIEDLEIIATGKVDLIEAQRKKLADAYDGMPDKTTPEAKALESRIKTLQDAENSLTAAGDKYLTKEDAGKTYSKKDPNSGRSANDEWAWSRRAGNASATGLNASATGVSVGVTGLSISTGVASWSVWGISDSTVGVGGAQTLTKMNILGAAEKLAAQNMDNKIVNACNSALQDVNRAISNGLDGIKNEIAQLSVHT